MNLGQYLVARGSDLPLRDLEIEMLKPLTPDEAPKGMAEVVMVPIVPALINAIHDATGVWVSDGCRGQFALGKLIREQTAYPFGRPADYGEASFGP